MTFSPEDSYASSIPVPDDKEFDTLGPELEPLDGEAAPAEVAPATEEVYSEEQQAADAELYSVAEKPTNRLESNLTNNYTLKDGTKVEITGKVYTSYEGPQENGQIKVEVPVTITDPNGPGEFRGVDRWSKYVLIVDRVSGDAEWASRVDRIFDEKSQSYNENGPTYKLGREDVEAVLKTSAVSKALHS